MLAWIPIDLYVLDYETVKVLTFTRVLFAVIMLSVAFYKPVTTNLRKGQLSLFFLIAIMVSFFAFANIELQHVNWDDTNVFIKSAYAHIPILILILLCLFPLTMFEFSALFIFVFAVTLGLGFQVTTPAFMLVETGTLWIVISVGLLALIASTSLLYYVLKLLRTMSHDDMTKCFRRDHGETLLATLLEIYKRKEEPLAIAFIDLDNFKAVNDDFGHEAGD